MTWVNSLGHVLFPFARWQHDHAQTPLPCHSPSPVGRADCMCLHGRPCVWLPFAAACCYNLFYLLMMPAARLVCQRQSSTLLRRASIRLAWYRHMPALSLHKFFKFRQAFGLIVKISPEFGLIYKIRPNMWSKIKLNLNDPVLSATA